MRWWGPNRPHLYPLGSPFVFWRFSDRFSITKKFLDVEVTNSLWDKLAWVVSCCDSFAMVVSLAIFLRTLESCTAAFSFQVCARDLSNCWREYLSGRTKVEYECFFQKENHVGWQLTSIWCKNTYYSTVPTYFTKANIYDVFKISDDESSYDRPMNLHGRAFVDSG